MPTNFELKRLKPKLDIAKKPENRVHELTDSNVSPPKLDCEKLEKYVTFFKTLFKGKNFAVRKVREGVNSILTTILRF